MKRLSITFFLTLLMSVVGTNSFSQNNSFQRSFFGFSLLDTKQTVEMRLKRNGYGYTQETNGNLQIIVMKPCNFGGVKWTDVELTFYKNQLFAVRFHKPEDSNMQSEMNRLAVDLINKYGRRMFQVFTWWNDPNRYTGLSGKDNNHTEIVLDYTWGLVLKYFDQRVAYSSTHPWSGDL